MKVWIEAVETSTHWWGLDRLTESLDGVSYNGVSFWQNNLLFFWFNWSLLSSGETDHSDCFAWSNVSVQLAFLLEVGSTKVDKLLMWRGSNCKQRLGWRRTSPYKSSNDFEPHYPSNSYEDTQADMEAEMIGQTYHGISWVKLTGNGNLEIFDLSRYHRESDKNIQVQKCRLSKSHSLPRPARSWGGLETRGQQKLGSLWGRNDPFVSLGGDFKYLLCSHLFGEMIHFDNIYQMGWNHQLGHFCHEFIGPIA